MPHPVSRRRALGYLGISSGLLTIAPLLQACSSAAPAASPAPAATAAKTAPTTVSASTPAPKPAPATAASQAAQTVTLQIWTSSGGQWAGWMTQAYKADVGGFRTKYPNIKPNVHGVPGWTNAYFPKIFTLVSTGTPFDVVWYPPRHRSSLAWGIEYKIVRSLNDLMKADNYDPKKNFLPGTLAAQSWEGQLYWFSYTGEPSVPIIAFNKTQIEKLGLSLPPGTVTAGTAPTEKLGMTEDWTYDDLIIWAKEATKAGFFGFDRGEAGTQPIGSTPEMRQYGVPLVDHTGKKVDFPQEQFTSWLQYRWDLMWKWKVSPKSGSNSPGLFTDGKLLAIPGWPVTLNLWPKVIVKDKFEIAFRRTPVLKKGDRIRTMLNEHVNGVASPRFCKHPQEAFQYLKWISSEEFALQGIVAGIGATIARPDFWNNPKLYKFSPQEKLLQELMLNIEPDFLVANWRGDQFETVFGNDYQKLELNKVTVDQAYTNIVKDCQALLNQPPA